MLVRHDTPVPDPQGATQVLLILGSGAGLWMDGFSGAELRVSSQVADEAVVGGGLAAGFNMDAPGDNPGNHARSLLSARALGRHNIAGLDQLAAEWGVGGGFTNTGIVYLTADAGILGGNDFVLSGGDGTGWRATPYGGPVFAVSVPLLEGEPIYEQKILVAFGPDGESVTTREEKSVETTFYFGATGGMGSLRASKHTAGATAELSLLYGFGTGEEEVVVFGISLAPALTLPP